MKIILHGAWKGTVPAIPSKSDAHRALISAALSDGETQIFCPLFSEDIRATARCLTALGADIEFREDGFFVRGGRFASSGTLDCGESGTTLRLLLPVAAAIGGRWTFVGHGRLPDRPIDSTTEELARHGIAFSSPRLPFLMSGRLSAGEYLVEGARSSQFLSGYLLALPLLDGQSAIRLTSPLSSAMYVEMTKATLSRFGVTYETAGDSYRLSPSAAYRTPGVYTAEGDWSNAAPFLAAGAIGTAVTVTSLPSETRQPDASLLSHLRAVGAAVRCDGQEVTVSRGELRPFAVDVSECPDLFPVLAVLAGAVSGESRLYGAARLRIKESDRIESTAAMLRALGVDCEPYEDALDIFGHGCFEGGTVDASGDHRIVMAAALASTRAKDLVVIVGAEAIRKSFPDFFTYVRTLGGIVREV